MINDLQTRKNRMAKKMVEANYKLANPDDFYGFSELPLIEKIKCSGWAILALLGLWVLLVIWGSF